MAKIGSARAGAGSLPLRLGRIRFTLVAEGSGEHRVGTALDTALAALVAFLLYFPVVVAQLHGSMTPFVVAFYLICATVILDLRRTGTAPHSALPLLTAYTVLIVVVARLLNSVEGSTYASSFERVILLMPLAGLAGWLLLRNGKLALYLSWQLLGAMMSVPLAIIEYTANVTLLNPDHAAYVRNGQTRAIVGADHPLVLGTLFVALIPMAVFLLGRVGNVAAIALYAGAWMTGSNGPELVGGVLLAVCLLPPLARTVLRTVAPLYTLLVGLAAFLVVGGVWLWDSQIHGTNTTDVSNEYRAALYHFLIGLLHERPFGFGFSGLPINTHFVFTLNGVVDVAMSIDSELIYTATQFGVLGVIAFAGIAALGARAGVQHHAIGLTLLTITLIGLFLAIHSWNSLGSFWFLIAGAAVAVVQGGHEATWRGMGVPYSTSAEEGSSDSERRSAVETSRVRAGSRLTPVSSGWDGAHVA